MATVAMAGSSGDPSAALNRTINTRNPLPLSASQESQVRDIYYKRVRGYCAVEIKEFAECARNRTFSATWLCREQRHAMNKCMVAHASQEELDKARAQWFSEADDRRKKREQDAAEREEKLRQKRLYWAGPNGQGPVDEKLPKR